MFRLVQALQFRMSHQRHQLMNDNQNVPAVPVKRKKSIPVVVAVNEEETTSKESDADMILESGMCSENFTHCDDVDIPSSCAGGQKPCVLGYKVNDIAIGSYNSSNYPGQIEEINDAGPIVKCMAKEKKMWYWLDKEDKMQYTWDCIVQKMNTPKHVSSKRNYYFNIPELNKYV
ncbi:hypothetical protein PR048_006403 [Dryococelus australis]|uniref:Uncharacterized protein n=1 Tax=Dryococelus australis TaxID=614101 RepID=A0ABQ9IAX0_9NEOP|nr:hypothetical protein PR048_006403 [Dryococelus australis]